MFVQPWEDLDHIKMPPVFTFLSQKYRKPLSETGNNPVTASFGESATQTLVEFYRPGEDVVINAWGGGMHPKLEGLVVFTLPIPLRGIQYRLATNMARRWWSYRVRWTVFTQPPKVHNRISPKTAQWSCTNQLGSSLQSQSSPSAT